MKKARTVILLFAGFVVVGGGVLVYGLLSRSAAARQTRSLLDSADQVLNVSLQKLAEKSPGDRKELLNRARQLRRDVQSRSAAPQAKADMLGTWIRRCSALEAAIERKRRELARLERALDYEFPPDVGAKKKAKAVVQLAPATEARLQAAIGEAGRADQLLEAKVDGRTVDLSDIFAGKVRDLRSTGEKLAAELAGRRNAFDSFVRGVRTALDQGQREEARKQAENLDDWFCCVVDVPEKKQRLEDLERRLAGTDRRNIESRVLRERLGGLWAGLESPSAAVNDVALRQYEEVCGAASSFGDLKGELDRARQAYRKLQAKRQAQQRAREQSRRMQKRLEDILFKLGELLEKREKAAKLSEKERRVAATQWVKQVQEPKKAISSLGSGPLAALLTALLEETNPKPPPLPAAPKDIIVRHYTEPNWSKLDGNLRKLSGLANWCRGVGKVRFQNMAKALQTYVSSVTKFRDDHAKRVAKKNEEEQKKVNERLRKEQEQRKKKQEKPKKDRPKKTPGASTRPAGAKGS